MNVIIGVPAYGGSVRIEFTLRLVATVIALLHAGHEVDVIYTASESLIPRARNSIATKALATKFTHLLWIDADSVFDPKDILRLLEAAKPIVALPYAIKHLDWQAIAEAARIGVPAGELAAAGTTSVGKDGVACGTGTMLVERRVFEAMAAQPERWYTPPPLTAQVSGIQKECEFYRAGVVDGVFLPEDFSFCLSARALGFESQLLEANTGHIGSFTYEHRAVTPQCDAVK